MDISLLLDLAADGFGERTALGSRGAGVTYARLRDTARSAAAWLSEHPGEHVAFVGTNSPIVPITLFASALVGRPFVPVNYRLADARLETLLERLAPAIAIVDEAVPARVTPAGVELVTESQCLAALEHRAPSRGALETIDPDGPAALLFTSGTTADAKAAVLRHRHLVAYVLSTVAFMSAGEDEATLVSVPPYHVAAISAILTSVYGGRRIVYLRAFDAERWVATAREESITHAMVVPTMLARILDALERGERDLPALRHLSYGGGPMPLPLLERALAQLPDVGFVNAYGLTETSSTISLLGPEEHREAMTSQDPRAQRRLRSVGRPLPSVEVAIVDAAGAPLAPGEWGEISVRGEQVSGEYTGAERGGDWFRTRDRGMLDADGFLYLDGRLDDVIVRGGENLSPGAIEEVLLAHPAVSAAAVVAAPSREWGEQPVAFVVATAVTEDELQSWVRERLRSASMPTRVLFRDELPYTDTGKLLRRQLRTELSQQST